MPVPVRRTPARSTVRSIPVHPATERARLLGWLGAAVGLLGWLALYAVLDLGKTGRWLAALAPICVIGGVLLARSHRRRLLWVGVAVAGAAYLAVAFTPVVTLLHPERLVRRDTLPPQLDAVIVLSGGITPDSLLGPQVVDRLLAGLELMRDSMATTLVVTRPRRLDTRASADPDQARIRALVARPFPVLVVDSVRTTRDEAVRAWALLGPRGITRVAVVTTPLHTRRACAAFERAGFAVTCVPSASRSYSVRQPRSAGERLAVFHAWMYEQAALAEYAWRGWLR
jgi:uncharacterized SAM-binding protein YcdF (DUF218 family)